MKEYKVKIERQITVTQEDIDDIMCSALEGGINYWCRKAEVVGDYLGEYASEQISRGGLLKLYDSEEDEVYVLTLEKLLKGIKQAIEENCYAEYEWALGDGIDTCQVDADVADCIIQFGLFGEVVYG
jgi:hypothetical protein